MDSTTRFTRSHRGLALLGACMALLTTGTGLAAPGDSALALGRTAAAGHAASSTPTVTEADSAEVAAVLSWQELERYAAAHPVVRASEHAHREARAGVAAAGAVPNPTLEGSWGLGQARDAEAQRFEWGLELAIPLDWVATRGPRVAAAEKLAQAAAIDTEAARWEVRQALRATFWRTALEQARLVALEALARELAELLRAVSRRVEQEQARPTDQLRVELEVEQLAGAVDAARSRRDAQQRQLAAMLGFPRAARVAVRADPTVLPSVRDKGPVVVERLPAVRAGEANLQALAAELDAEQLARVPAMQLRGYTEHELDRRSYGLGFSVALPLWNWNTGRIDQASARLQAARERLAADRRRLEGQAIEVESACERQVAQALRYQRAIVPRAEEIARSAQRTYELGEASLEQLVVARRMLLEVRGTGLEAAASAQLECAARFGAGAEESR